MAQTPTNLVITGLIRAGGIDWLPEKGLLTSVPVGHARIGFDPRAGVPRVTANVAVTWGGKPSKGTPKDKRLKGNKKGK